LSLCSRSWQQRRQSRTGEIHQDEQSQE
jgi:hypothetical protein